MKLRNFILIVAFTISSFSILVSGKPSSRRLKNQRNKEAEEGIAKNDAASAASITPSTGSLSSSNVSVSSMEDSVLTLPTSALKSKKLKKSHRLKHRRFGHHHKKHNRRSHSHRGGNRRHHNSTKHDDPISSAHNVTSSELPSTLINREQADIPSLKLLRSSRSGHRKFKRHHNHHHRPQNRRPSKRVKEQLAGESKGE